MKKKKIVVLFGGSSSEHEVSCMSVLNVIDNIDTEKYEVILVGITKEGRWLLTESRGAIVSGSWREGSVRAVISPDREAKELVIMENGAVRSEKIDVVFPVLHGLYGEDGTVQGLLELAGIPYVGCGVVSSAASMDKWFTKRVIQSAGIRQADYEMVFRQELEAISDVIARIEAHLPYPVFVKPCNAGSSQGVSKADNAVELASALRLAAEHDSRILVEETIVGREIECAVLGGSEAMASGVGEILAAADFYDYDAKYNNEESKTVVDPDLPAQAVEEVRASALRIFREMACFGLSRVDFFVTGEGEVVFNEINTMPGFTAISMYPMLWEARGISKPQLVDRLIDLAFERNE